MLAVSDCYLIFRSVEVDGLLADMASPGCAIDVHIILGHEQPLLIEVVPNGLVRELEKLSNKPHNTIRPTMELILFVELWEVALYLVANGARDVALILKGLVGVHWVILLGRFEDGFEVGVDHEGRLGRESRQI